MHKLLVLSMWPAGWPTHLFVFACFVIIILPVLVWRLAAGIETAGVLLGILTLSLCGDFVILRLLPRRRISNGPVQSQLLILTGGRAATTLLLTTLIPVSGTHVSLILAGLFNLCAALALFWGSHIEPASIGISRLVVSPSIAPHHARSLRLLHVSDLHAEFFGKREEDLIQKARRLEPELILITGDFVPHAATACPQSQSAARRVLRSLAMICPVYAVLGSSPVDRHAVDLFDGLDIYLLRDQVEHVLLPNHMTIGLIGLDCHHHVHDDAEMLANLAAGVSEGAFRVLLYHSPDLAPHAPSCGIDLYLCGHTHGGQVRLPFWGALITSSHWGKRYEMGHYQIKDNRGESDLYVSRGLGMEGMGAPRVRFLCRPEITLISLVPQNQRYFSTDD